LRVPGHVVTFTRNWAQILVNDTPLVLDAPVRVKRGVWLVPESFVGRVLPGLAPGVAVVTAQAGPGAPAPAVTLAELRFRSYPSFTRVVLGFWRPTATGPRQEELMPLRTIVLDAGHGGHDPGAMGPTGLTEKGLVLDVTRRVARLAEEQLGVRVLLTRDADYFVSLAD